MREIGAFEAKNTLGTLLDRVEEGEEIVITRHGRRVARLAPYRQGVSRPEAHEAVKRIRTRAAVLRPGGFSWEDLKADRDRGRP